MLDIDTSKLPAIDRIISQCKVIDLGSGGAPKNITVELPNSDGSRVLARWSGFPPLAVNDYCIIQRVEMETQYLVVGASAATVAASLNNFSATADPTVNDDSGDGYGVGSLWVNITSDQAWICVDATATAAVWDQIDIAGIAETLIDAKGDLIAGSAADTAARLPVGSNDQVLTADSGEATGLKWSGAVGNGGAAPNAIINGDFPFWQRSTSIAAITDDAFVADRFAYKKSGVMVHTVSRSTTVPTQAQSGHQSTYSLKVDCTTIDASITGSDHTAISYKVEGYDFARFVGQTVTLQFWVRATKTGTYCVAFRNSGTDRSYVIEYTISSADTWEKKTVSLTFDYSGGTWDYTNGTGIEIGWVLAAGSTLHTTADAWQTGNFIATSNQVNGVDNVANDFFLSQIQFATTVPSTGFVSAGESIQGEMALCQRYYTKTFPLATAPADNAGPDGCLIGKGVTTNVAEPTANWQFPIIMRTAPTVSRYNPWSGTSGEWSNGAVDSSNARATHISERSCVVDNTGNTLVAANRYRIHCTATAEL